MNLFIVLQDGDVEQECMVKVDDCGFFIYWKSELRVRQSISTSDSAVGKKLFAKKLFIKLDSSRKTLEYCVKVSFVLANKGFAYSTVSHYAI